jgi:hypothetical protein
MPLDFRDAPDAEKARHKKGRPRLDPAAPLTPAERAACYRAKHRDKINRTRRLRAKVAAILNGRPVESVAHQRRIRDRIALDDPTEVAASLKDYTVGVIDKRVAEPLIKRFEWLGTCGNTVIFVGLFAPGRDLQGVAAFGRGPATVSARIGSPAFCLERGACTHKAPRNGASFLINAACKLVYRITGVSRFFAYADPMAGEYGAAYQAAGWAYLGQGQHGGGYRTHRHGLLAPGRNPDDPAQWRTSRALRRHGRHLSFEEALAAGWLIETRPAKHVYATHVGRDRKAWRKGLPELPYPKPWPELTLAARTSRKAGE